MCWPAWPAYGHCESSGDRREATHDAHGLVADHIYQVQEGS